MRRTPSIDTITTTAAAGATGTASFAAAYRSLAEARLAYDALLGDPERVPALADAALRLDAARRTMRELSLAA